MSHFDNKNAWIHHTIREHQNNACNVSGYATKEFERKNSKKQGGSRGKRKRDLQDVGSVTEHELRPSLRQCGNTSGPDSQYTHVGMDILIDPVLKDTNLSMKVLSKQ